MPRPKDHAGKDSISRRATSRAVIGAVPREFKPPRDVLVPTVSAVACPSCMAPIGEKCISITNGNTCTAHPSRRRMAVRLRNQQLGDTA